MITIKKQTCYCCEGESYDPDTGDKLHAVNDSNDEFACDTCLHNDHSKCDGCEKHFHCDYIQQEYEDIDLWGGYCDGCAHDAAQSILDNQSGEDDLRSWYNSQCI